jgi:hypothetical protein
MRRRLLPLVTLLCALAAPVPAHAARQQEAQFQDDPRLVYAKPADAMHTLDILQGLGVDRIRVSVFWRIVAPGAEQDIHPFFDASDPAAYPPGAWDRYDLLVRQAAARGIGINLNVTSPAPDWATGNAPRSDIDPTFDPSAKEFGLFMQALGKRYSGRYVPAPGQAPLPRVNYWSIWNEPNQPGWLTPQWAADPRDPKNLVETAPRIYRGLVDAAYSALVATGHEKDTILVGETAPKGQKTARGTTRAVNALAFIRGLYCLDKNLQFEQGTSAQLRGCPVADQRGKFVAEHPGLFRYTGYAHHPYELTFAPNVKPGFADWVTIANLPDLSRLLRRIFQRYGQPLPGNAKKGVPLYLTEFGYQTNPPDPTAVSPRKQAAYINQSEYIAYRDPTVKTLTQFLLVDDAPVPGVSKSSPAAWLTFQSGLLYLNGTHKPSYAAYQLPIHLPQRRVRRGGKLRVWGGVRVAPAGTRQPVTIELRPRKRKRYRRIGSATTDGLRGYLTTRVRITRAGAVRLRWRDPRTGRVLHSASVDVTVRR